MENILPGNSSFPLKYLQKLKNILIVYNEPDKNLDADEELTEADTLDEVNQVKKVFDLAGFSSKIFGLREKTIDDFFETKADFIFNLCYGIGSLPDTEKEVYRIFDKSGIPYTGGPGNAIEISNNKGDAKELFLKNNISTPGYIIVNSLKDLNNLFMQYPLIIKTSDLGCSLGMDQKSVVTNFSDLKYKVSEQLKKYNRPVLIEQYVEGREFSVFILGNGEKLKVFPPVEIVFGPIFASTKHWKIFDFDAKWNQNSVYCKETPYVCPVAINSELNKKIVEITKKTFQSIGCYDYARLDLRIDKQNNPNVLEINLNPSIGHDSQVEIGVRALNLTFDDLIFGIISVALKRYYGRKIPIFYPFMNARL